MNHNEYKAYLLSNNWQQKRGCAIMRDESRCAICGIEGNGSSLHIHHLSYKNAGNENVDDLATLCKRCHNDIHQRKFFGKEEMLDMRQEFYDKKEEKYQRNRRGETEKMVRVADIVNSRYGLAVELHEKHLPS
jgi:5-methylcytosine-specific restriction endonuclease McrA